MRPVDPAEQELIALSPLSFQYPSLLSSTTIPAIQPPSPSPLRLHLRLSLRCLPLPRRIPHTGNQRRREIHITQILRRRNIKRTARRKSNLMNIRRGRNIKGIRIERRAREIVARKVRHVEVPQVEVAGVDFGGEDAIEVSL